MSLLKKIFGKPEPSVKIEDRDAPAEGPKAEEAVEPAPQIVEEPVGAEPAKAKPKKRSSGIDWDMPNTDQARHVKGALLKYEDVQLYTEEELKNAHKLIVKGIMDGSPFEDIAKKLSNATKRDFDECHDLVRTVMAQAAVDADVEEFRELGIAQYQIHAVLDDKTCPLCGQYDLKVFDLEDGPKPPFHKNCRCYISTALSVPNAKRAARGEDGKTIQVPGDMTWSDWDEARRGRTDPYEPENKGR